MSGRAGLRVTILNLVRVNDHRLVARSGDPFLHRRERHYGLAIGFRLPLELDLVRAEPGYDRGIGCIGNAEMPEQESAFPLAKAFTAIAPDRHDPIDFYLNLRGHAAVGEARTHIHRQMTAQRLKPRMEFRADCAGDRTRVVIPRPELECRERFGQVLANRQAVPDHELAMPQGRDGSRRRILHDGRLARRLVERDDDFVERYPGLLENEPRPKRPRGVILVPEIDRQIGHEAPCLNRWDVNSAENRVGAQWVAEEAARRGRFSASRGRRSTRDVERRGEGRFRSSGGARARSEWT